MSPGDHSTTLRVVAPDDERNPIDYEAVPTRRGNLLEEIVEWLGPEWFLLLALFAIFGGLGYLAVSQSVWMALAGGFAVLIGVATIAYVLWQQAIWVRRRPLRRRRR